jgi:hypothetical protein
MIAATFPGRAIRHVAAVAWALLLLGWAATGFRESFAGLLSDALKLSEQAGRVMGIFAGFVIALAMIGVVLEAAFFAVVAAALLAKKLTRGGR